MPSPRRQAISGLKYSQGLCLLRLGLPLHDGAVGLCQALAGQEINLVFVGGGSEVHGPGELCLCLREEHLAQAWQAARALGGGGEAASPEVIAPVALVTIYPLGPGLSLCGRVLAALAGAGLTHLALGTSLSALVVALPQDDLAQALEALQGLLELPAGVAPTFQPVTMLTVAKRPPA